MFLVWLFLGGFFFVFVSVFYKICFCSFFKFGLFVSLFFFLSFVYGLLKIFVHDVFCRW
jgi:hypothetical protein